MAVVEAHCGRGRDGCEHRLVLVGQRRVLLSVALDVYKRQGIYLVAQLSCCVDSLLATRAPTTALCLNTGAAYVDETGAWLDPYNETVSQYIIELCEDLIGLGFDEILLNNLSMPITDAAIGYQVQLSSTPSPEAAICGLSMEITNALDSYGVPVSVILNTNSLRNGLAAQSGQNLELFGKVFDRFCSATDSAWLSGVDRDSVDQYFELGDPAQRYVPMMAYIPEGFSTCICLLYTSRCVEETGCITPRSPWPAGTSPRSARSIFSCGATKSRSRYMSRSS